MIVLNCHTGRMSNRKIMLAHVMARALTRGERWHITDECSWLWRLERMTVGRIWNRFVRMLPEARGSRCRCLRLPGLMIVHGFTELRDFEDMKACGDEIRRTFGRGDAAILRRKSGEIVVGIHKRRGDYRTWKGGRYCYGDDVWERVMSEMRALLAPRPVSFAVFSDENAVRSAEEDQALMAQCDYLIGPPSTFTTWASFMGKVPLLHLLGADQPVRLRDFNRQWEES